MRTLSPNSSPDKMKMLVRARQQNREEEKQAKKQRTA